MTSFKPWVIATRLRTLPLVFSGILMGTSLASNEVRLNYGVVAFTLLTAILLQILSNFANDYGDAISGVDSEQRAGPDGMVQTGAISKKVMRNVLLIFSFLVLISGLILLYFSFLGDWELSLIFFGIGLLAIVAAIKYTVGKKPYGYVGLGDVFVYIFFGMVAVLGTCFLQTKTIDWQLLLPASSMGLFAVGVLNVNNIRDMESDKVTGKFSIPVRLGKRNASLYHTLILSTAFFSCILFVVLDFDKWTELLFIIMSPLLVKNIRAIHSKTSSELDPLLRQMVLSTLLFSILFSIGQFIA